MKLHLSRPRLPHIQLHRPHLTAHDWAIIIKALTVAGIIFLIFMLVNINATTNRLAARADATAQQNQRIARANGRHIDCLAELVAQYTRNNKPITRTDLDKCKITEQEVAGIASVEAITGAIDFAPAPRPAAQEPTKTTPDNNTQLPTATKKNLTNSQQRKNSVATPGPENRTYKVLGVPLCIPATGKCVR